MMLIEEIFLKFQNQLRELSQNQEIFFTYEEKLNEIGKAKVDVIDRFVKVYNDFLKNKAGISDILAIIRQIVRTFRPIEIPNSLWKKINKDATDYFLFAEKMDKDYVRILGSDWKAEWLEGSEKIDHLELRRIEESVPGDGMISALQPGWTKYRSSAQKSAVDAWMFAAPGSTTIVTLPTGEGKSLCTILPPWFDSKGGSVARGTTIVIVPTVALAQDQQKQARMYFKYAKDDFFEPWSQTGDTNLEVRKEIENAILGGVLPILYTSPESLIRSRLYGVCLQAAKEGKISRLVIDEAHLVETWGAGFRVEFQLLSTYRKLLLEASKGKLRTLLLSATVTNSAFDVLQTLFSEERSLITLQANKIRSEIEYYFDYSSSENVRYRKLLEAIRILPRPLIIYVTRPVQAEEWTKDLKKAGYKRVASFHGQTENVERRRLIRSWEANELDIMVATSAFGLGIDKRHVRSIVHATTPENLDRFYQEVGRGGRDGCRSISLISVTENDRDLASSLLPKLLTVDNAYQRWLTMKESAKNHPDLDGVILINQDAIKKDAPLMQTSDTNRDWNLHMLLLMQRAGLIEIAEIPPINNKEENNEISWLPIRILQPNIFNDEKKFKHSFEETRKSEQLEIKKSRNHIFGLVKKFAKKTTSESSGLKPCMAIEIGQMYSRSQINCSGCPTCRESKNMCKIPNKPTEFMINYPDFIASKICSEIKIDEDLRNNKMGGYRQFSLIWEGSSLADFSRKYISDIARIFWKGFEQIIYPEDFLMDPEICEKFIKLLSVPPDPNRVHHKHRLIPINWLLKKNSPTFSLNTMVIYPREVFQSESLLHKIQYLKQVGIEFPYTLNIINSNQKLSNGNYLLDLLDGIDENIDWYLDGVKESSQDDFVLF